MSGLAAVWVPRMTLRLTWTQRGLTADYPWTSCLPWLASAAILVALWRRSQGAKRALAGAAAVIAVGAAALRSTYVLDLSASGIRQAYALRSTELAWTDVAAVEVAADRIALRGKGANVLAIGATLSRDDRPRLLRAISRRVSESKQVDR